MAAKPAGVILTAGHAGRQAPVGEIHGGPDVADRAVDDICGNQHRTVSCVVQKSLRRDARMLAAAYRRDYSQPLRMNSTIE
ncbi:hypothetical protein HR51_07945 [Burkholderia cepacia]|nr:hypothetical protein HR51_07945 [Burkholderia cepacia]